jgi:hypothetical protein
MLYNNRHWAAADKSPRTLAKTTGLEWKKISSTQYSNADFFGSSVSWEFSSRDTVVYDLRGNMILTKTSSAGSGWSQDSLQSLDSCIYADGRLAEEIQENFYNYGMGQEMNGYRDTCGEMDNGKVMVSIHYDWDNTKKTWKPSYKDSIVVSAPIGNFVIGDIASLVREDMWSYDTSTGLWKTMGSIARIDSECTANILVLAGRSSADGSDSLVDIKSIITFASPAKTMQNITEERLQRKGPVSGKYYDSYRVLITLDKSGFSTNLQFFVWDSLSRQLENSSLSMMFPDAYGNDTLEFSCDYDSATGSWDTTFGTRFTLSYDAFGNNVSMVASFFDDLDRTWHVQTRDTVVFAQVNSRVVREVPPAFAQDLVFKKTPASVRFTASGISGLRLYDMTGRLVVSMSQKPGPFIELGFKAYGALIRSGIYVARVKIGDTERSFKIPVLR